ncbi:Rap1 GTPase-GDP dissociation stimulator 1 [Entophlyctis luteolus]|nr:Rap1 GTPase-GDP dissociation stimulator 1 [Entophlyctis luteolus]
MADDSGLSLERLEALCPRDDAARAALAADIILLEKVSHTLANPATDERTATAAAKLVAESAKTEESRKPLAEAGVLPHLISLLRGCLAAEVNAKDELILQILRSLGNMCFDNDENREALAELDGALAAATKCLSSANKSVVNVACGALLNISMDNEVVQLQIVEANGVEGLLHLFESAIDNLSDRANFALASSALTTLANLLETEKGIHAFVAANGLPLTLRALRAQHDELTSPTLTAERFQSAVEIADSIVTVLEIVAENDVVQRLVVSQNFLNFLLDFVDHRSSFSLPSSESNEDSVDYDDVFKRVSKLVILVTLNGGVFGVYSPITFLADANMMEIPKHSDVMNRFKQWLTLGFHTGKELEEDDIRMSGALCVGNLARSDESCKALMKEHNIGSALLQLLTMEVDRAKQEHEVLITGAGPDSSAVAAVRSCVKVIHAVVGAFKNLSIAGLSNPILTH